MDFAQATAAMKRFLLAMRRLNGALASSRTGYPILHELDEIEWAFGERRSYYGDHPYVLAATRRYSHPLSFPMRQLVGGAARVLVHPLEAGAPTTIADVLNMAGEPRDGWLDFGATR